MTTDLRARVQMAISVLGDTADEVADSLRAHGIKGQLDNCEECALAVYLNHALADVMPSIYCIAVNGKFVSVDYTTHGEDRLVDVCLSTAAINFIVNFDRGVYLDLVKSEAGAA